MNTTEGLQKNILDATLRVFDQKGLKFTMDDLAKELSISWIVGSQPVESLSSTFW